MQRRARPIICGAHVKTLIFEKLQANWLVTLGSSVQNINAELIRAELISSLLNQELAQMHITFEWTEVKCSESVLFCLVVTVIGEFHRFERPLPHSDKEPRNSLMVMETGLVENRIAAIINDLIY